VRTVWMTGPMAEWSIIIVMIYICPWRVEKRGSIFRGERRRLLLLLLTRTRTALLFYTWDTSARPFVLRTQDEPICHDNEVPRVQSISSLDPSSHDPDNGNPTTGASPAYRSVRTRVHLHEEKKT
jgi:hypothetical protein